MFGEFGGHWSFVMISGQLAHSRFCALFGIARYVLLEDESYGQPAIALKEQ